MKRIFLYGIGGADKQFRVLKYYVMEEDAVSIWNIRYQADMLKIKNPSIEHVYAVDDRHGLYRDYKESIRTLKYYVMEEDAVSIWNIRYQADMLKIKNPSIEHVYAVDDRHGLYRDYKESIRKNSIESCAIFKDILEREGLKII